MVAGRRSLSPPPLPISQQSLSLPLNLLALTSSLPFPTLFCANRGLDNGDHFNVVVYNGEEHFDCPSCDEEWTTQGPYCYDGHNATDYALPGNTPVLAAASGQVTFRGWRSQYYGNSIRIDHGNGYETWYSHLAAFSVNLNDILESLSLIHI